jgi:hypothetical protein
VFSFDCFLVDENFFFFFFFLFMYLEGIYKGGATSRSEKDVKFKCDLELSCDFGSDAFFFFFF